MASFATMRSDTPGPTSKQIPLVCIVCPDRPRFSDVSHLLTHIASKGHLHHETQTRLKTHQEVEATVVMDQYDAWYRQNGIEALLVDRMRAKQLKEAVKTRRARGVPPLAIAKIKRRAKRSSSCATSRSGQEQLTPEDSLSPAYFVADCDSEQLNDEFPTNDSLSLKGQVWPGMGKMDLANEDMRRTRNQRKPNSVIEKMRRTSEGIEPTQVVMTPDLEVERVKGVYDGSSPIPSELDETPKKAAKPKRKRAEVLAEIPANIPRGPPRRPADRTMTGISKLPDVKNENDGDTNSENCSALRGFQNGPDLFQDDDGGHGRLAFPDVAQPVNLTGPDFINDRSFFSPTHHTSKFSNRQPQVRANRNLVQPRYAANDRLGLHSLNLPSRSFAMSPTPSRDPTARLFSSRDSQRGGGYANGYLTQSSHLGLGEWPNACRDGHVQALEVLTDLGSLMSSEVPFDISDSTAFSSSSRLPFAANNHLGAFSHDAFRMNSNGLPQSNKLEDYTTLADDSFSSSNSSQFLALSESNPLFSHDRTFLTPFSQAQSTPSLSSFSFTPVNRGRDHGHAIHDVDHCTSVPEIKAESQMCNDVEDDPSSNVKTSTFALSGIWDAHVSDPDVDANDELGEALDV